MLPCSELRELKLRGLAQALMHLVLLKLELVLQLDLQGLQELSQHCERQVVSELVAQVLLELQELAELELQELAELEPLVLLQLEQLA
jgi:hypothetical protein